MDIGVILRVLWPYLVAMYILDCFVVVRCGHLVLAGSVFKDLAVKGAGLRLTGLLPWGCSFLAAREPALLSGKGIYVRAVPCTDDHRPLRPEDLEFIDYEEMGKVSNRGRKVLVDGKVIHAASTAFAASIFIRNLRTVLRALPDQRMKRVTELLEASTNLEAVKEEVGRIRNLSSLLIRTSSLLSLLLFTALPVSLLARLPFFWLWGELIVIVAVCICVAVLWARAHSALLPGEPCDRLEELLVFALFPVSLVHAFWKLTKRLLAPYEDVALVAALAPGRAGDILKREYLRLQVAADRGHAEDLKTLLNTRKRILRRLAEQVRVDLSPGSLLPAGKNGERVCPLCTAAYHESVEECADCGLPLCSGPGAVTRDLIPG